MTRPATPIPWEPRPYMERAVEALVERGAMGLFADPGLGKTSCTLAALRILREERIAKTALVVAPLRVCRHVWPSEAAKWADFADTRVEVLHGSKKDAALAREADVYCVNPEGLDWYVDAVAGGARLPDVLVMDESTLFKNKQSGRSKALRSMAPYFRRRYSLTGTPAPNGLVDLFGQVLLLDLGATFGPFVGRFRNEYFDQDVVHNRWVPKPGAEEAIYKKLGPLAFRLDERDHLELPELSEVYVDVDLPPKARKAYDQLEATLVADLESGRVAAMNAAGVTSKLRQLTSGAAYADDGAALPAHGEKYSAVFELLDEMRGQAAIVFYEYVSERDALAARLEREGYAWADMGPKATASQERESQARLDAGDLEVVLAHPKSAARGLNMQRASVEIWTSGTWDLELYLQGIKRVHRSGQVRRCTVFRLVCPGTIDELVWARVDQKDAAQRRLLDALRDHYGLNARRVGRVMRADEVD